MNAKYWPDKKPDSLKGDEMKARTIIWFSCGCASFACAYLLRKKDAVLVYCDTGGEHEDNKRFLKDSEALLNRKITILKNGKYKDHMDVCEKTKYINGPYGARCTVELKKKLRFEFERPDDVQVFGYTVDEKDRADRLRKAYPEINAIFPLIDNNLTKDNCVGLVSRLGLRIPTMYSLGFNNNNCIGCVKGGMGYWNQIRKHFPDQFSRMASIERKVGHSCVKGVFLDELDPDRGHRLKEKPISCDFICQSVLDD